MARKRRREAFKHFRRWLQASLRDAAILLGEFRAPLLWFSFAVLGGGLLYDWLSRLYGEPLDSLAEAIYTVLTIAFFQPPNREFPHHFALQLFYFVMPVIGLAILAQGLADFGRLFFNRRARSKEWEMAVASTLNKHIVLVGLGHLGYRVASKLHEAGEPLAVIEADPTSDTANAARRMGIPVIQDDATRAAALEGANVRNARVIILASQNDSMNLQIALKARGMNPNLKVVIRIFDEEFAHALQEQFGFIALSATEMAAPVFAAAATGTDIASPISIEGELLSLARIAVQPASPLAQKSIGEMESEYHVTVVLHRRGNKSQMHPAEDVSLRAGDSLAVLGGPDELHRLLRENERV